MKRKLMAIAICAVLLSGCSGGSGEASLQYPQLTQSSSGEEIPESKPQASESKPELPESKPQPPESSSEPPKSTSSAPISSKPPVTLFPEYNAEYVDYLSGRFTEEEKRYINSLSFMGDSTCLSFANYGLLSRTRCFADVGISVRNIGARQFEVDGRPYSPEEALRKTGCGEFYFMLGLNDINILECPEYIEGYELFLRRVESACPDARIHVVSITPVLSGSGFCSAGRIAEFNSALKQMTVRCGWEYTDLFTLVSDGNGHLRYDYAMADGVHMRIAAYYGFLEYLVSSRGG